MWDFSVGAALHLMRQTLPFVLFRVVVYFTIAVAYVLATGAGAGIGWGVGAAGDEEFRAQAIFWGGTAGFGLTAGVILFLRQYILYIVKAGHIAVMVEFMEGRDLPAGRSQITHARDVVQTRFATANVLFGVDLLIKGVLKAVTGLVQGLSNLLPIPGVNQMMGIIRAFLRLAVGMIDEVILAYLIRAKSENPWRDAQTALILYGQNYKPMLKNAFWLTFIVYGLAALVFVIMLVPAAAVVYLIPGAWSAGGFVFALLFAWAFKVALIEPFAVACMLQVYFGKIEGQTPDPVWEEKLSSISTKFRKLGERATGWALDKSPNTKAESVTSE